MAHPRRDHIPRARAGSLRHFPYGPSPFQAEEDYLNNLTIDERGTPYPCDLVALALHRDPYLLPKNPPEHHWRTVTEYVEGLNDPLRPLNPEQKAALQRLQDLGKLKEWGTDMIFKIFLDCDLLFFGSKLRDNIYLKFVIDPEMDACAYTAPHGLISHRIGIAIRVDCYINKYFPVHEAIGTLLHEMCHAILMVHCPHDQSNATIDTAIQMWDPTYDAGHAEAFCRCMAAVQRRLGPTRFLRLSVVLGERGGTVDPQSELGIQWTLQGGFRT